MQVVSMETRDIRKTLVVTATEEKDFHDHLNTVNAARRRQGQKRLSFSAYAIHAVKEQIQREQAV